MKDFSLEHILSITKDRKPNFENLKAVLRGEAPDRPTLFEFFLNDPLERKIADWPTAPTVKSDEVDYFRCKIQAFRNMGYDYTTIHASNYEFHRGESEAKKTISADHGCVIFDRETFDAYQWEQPDDYYDGRIERLEKYLPDGMKFIVCGPSGVLENLINLVGYTNMCYLAMDDPELLGKVFDHVGQRLYDYYARIINYDSVGAIISNDDWGFNTQTMLSTEDMRKYVFPWHKKIVKLAHDAGKPCILHSCGNLSAVWEDIIEDMQFDAKHSYEDKIQPVEEAYDFLAGRIAVVGGIDIDFVCRSEDQAVYDRCKAMIDKTGCKGYALGTGNSIPEYVPDEKYFAMISAALM